MQVIIIIVFGKNTVVIPVIHKLDLLAIDPKESLSYGMLVSESIDDHIKPNDFVSLHDDGSALGSSILIGLSSFPLSSFFNMPSFFATSAAV